MMAAICSRVTLPSGSKRPAPTPLTMPLPAAHATASVYHVPSATSVKDTAAVAVGLPSSRQRTVTSIARVIGMFGLNASAAVPLNSSFWFANFTLP